jgi:hypothetical protein
MAIKETGEVLCWLDVMFNYGSPVDEERSASE